MTARRKGRARTTGASGQLAYIRGSIVGFEPLLWVSDGTYKRVQAGNLADYVDPSGRDSPAQFGFRALDANGNNLFDRLGLINTMTSLGFKAATSSDSVSTANTTTWADFGADTQFTINVTTRPQRIIYFLNVSDVEFKAEPPASAARWCYQV